MAVKFSAFTTRTGTLDASTKIVGYDDPAGTKTNVEFSLATLVANSGIYGADGTIGTSRVATITDTPKFSGTQGNPIGLEIENTETSASTHSTQGAQLKLTARAGASSTISFYNGLGGGSSAPAMIIDSPAGIRNIAGGTYSGYYHLFSGSTWNVGITNSPLTSNSPSLEMLLGGGGSNASFYTTKVSGSSDFLYMFMSPGTSTRHIALGEYTNSTTTYKDFIRINSTGDVGINQDTPVEKLHVTGNVKIDGQGYTEFYDTANTTLTVDWNNSNIQELTGLTGSHTFTASNPKAGATYILTLAQTGAVTATWTGVKWPGGTAPTLSGTGKTDVVTLICYDATGAGLYYGSATLDLA